MTRFIKKKSRKGMGTVEIVIIIAVLVSLALLFRQFELGLVTVEMLAREMRFRQLTMQYSFHTSSAVAALEFVEVDDVY